MKRIFCLLLCFLILPITLYAAEDSDAWKPARLALVPSDLGELTLPVDNALLMERDTGKILFEKNADDRLYPASITKIMTLLLTMEAIEGGQLSYDQKLIVSRSAQELGGSTAFLHENEQYTVDEMLKAVAVQSANDGSVVLAEAIGGTQEAFAAMMNRKAKELGMTGTNFVNPHGLDDPEHYTTTRDVAIMSRELLLHPDIHKYTSIWMDSLRNGTFTLSNTNRLVRYYPGCTGLKTGTTDKAGRCISASAEKDGMEMIAVVMNAENTDDRYDSARKMLDYAFANYAIMAVWPDEVLVPVPVLLGREKDVQPVLSRDEKIIIEKHKKASVIKNVTIAQDVQAPVSKGQQLGEIIVSCGDDILVTVPITAGNDVARLTWWDVFKTMIKKLFLSEGNLAPL
ncbi:MAG: D-alanyl-D-alanine carboxypeptidase [Oscillospiraceae bacterium]|nr:D-alanyl-D-alanine carboxypeptidase [Oscillospiraceae bacterium]